MKCKVRLTKKDIVVVLVCVFFLLMNLGAVGTRGNEHAKRILCASRLQKWGKAIFMHSADNDDNLMFIPRRWGEGPFPHYMGMVKDGDYNAPGVSSEAEPGEWDLFRINPYIGAFSETFNPPDDCFTTRLVTCPSTDSEFMAQWNTNNCEWGWDYIEPAYSYWVIGWMPTPVDTGNPNNGSDGEAGDHVWQDLTVDTLSPDRLLMSDVLTIDNWGSSGSPYRYNHGRTGWSWPFYFGDVIVPTKYDPYPDATGRNQLFGDGHFEWRAISPEYENNLPNTNDEGFTEDQWNGPGSGWIQNWNTSWY